MRPSLTYEYYQANGGSLDAIAFNALCPSATALVDYLTATNAVVAPNEDSYFKGICAAIDSFAENGNDDNPLESVHVGSFSASTGGSKARSGNDLATIAATRYLALAVPSLLYGGIR
jgi:hypothetical protein